MIQMQRLRLIIAAALLHLCGAKVCDIRKHGATGTGQTAAPATHSGGRRPPPRVLEAQAAGLGLHLARRRAVEQSHLAEHLARSHDPEHGLFALFAG